MFLPVELYSLDQMAYVQTQFWGDVDDDETPYWSSPGCSQILNKTMDIQIRIQTRSLMK
jgi:hypothetical protein